MAARGEPKTGGRKPGSRNKATAERERVLAASGLTPLEYMLGVMRDEEAPQPARLDAAKAAAPFVHPRLSAVELSGPNGGEIETVTRFKLAPLE